MLDRLALPFDTTFDGDEFRAFSDSYVIVATDMLSEDEQMAFNALMSRATARVVAHNAHLDYVAEMTARLATIGVELRVSRADHATYGALWELRRNGVPMATYTPKDGVIGCDGEYTVWFVDGDELVKVAQRLTGDRAADARVIRGMTPTFDD